MPRKRNDSIIIEVKGVEVFKALVTAYKTKEIGRFVLDVTVVDGAKEDMFDNLKKQIKKQSKKGNKNGTD